MKPLKWCIFPSTDINHCPHTHRHTHNQTNKHTHTISHTQIEGYTTIQAVCEQLILAGESLCNSYSVTLRQLYCDN